VHAKWVKLKGREYLKNLSTAKEILSNEWVQGIK
jgi:hypothetical protein